jgi:hypothetical protein
MSNPNPPVDLATIVAKLTEFLDSVESLVPDYQVPHGKGAKGRVAATARFVEPLMQPTITAINSSQPLRDHNSFDPVAGAAALQYRDALRSLGQRMMAVGDALVYSGDAKVAPIGRSLLRTYGIAQRLVRDPEGAGLKPYVDELSSAVKKAVNRRPKVALPAGGHAFLGSSTAPDVDVENILEPDGLLPDDEE